MSQREVFISIDIEADGPIPGDNSMLSFGAAAFEMIPVETEIDGNPDHNTMPVVRFKWQLAGTFEANLEQLPLAVPNRDTMAWWKTQPQAWAECRKDLQDPASAMINFDKWLREMSRSGPLVIVGYPVTYDFMFLYWYYIHFCGSPAPFGFQGLDIKTLAMDRMSCHYKHATKRNMPKVWFTGAPAHTHKALDDAIGQGVLLMNILLDSKRDR